MGKKPIKLNEMNYFDFSLQPGKELASRISVNSGLPLISIITVYGEVYNEPNVAQTYMSLKNQTFPYWEWIVIANEEIEYLKITAKTDKRIKIVKSEEKNIANARLIAANMATTDLIYVLDEDNLIDKTMLECGYFSMLTNPEATFSYSRMVDFGTKEVLYNKKLSISDQKKKNYISSGSFVRKDKFLEVENYSKLSEYKIEDWYMWLYFLSKGYTPLKMGFYGFWHRNDKYKKTLKTKVANVDDVPLMKELIDKINNKTEIIQFDDSYEVDYKHVPVKFDLKRKPIVPIDDTKRVLFILPWSVVGGADIFNLNLIKGLRKKGYQISVITTQKCDYALRQQVEQYVDEYFDLTSFLKRKEWASFIQYIISSRRMNLVFLSNSYYGYYVLPWLKCQFKDVPFVDYIHAENWTLRNGGFPKDSNAVAGYLDATYTCTSYLKEVMYKTMKRDVKNIKPVHIGTDAEFFNPEFEFELEKELKERFEGKKVILFPSRIVHYKRPLFAISIVKELLKKRKDIVLAIVGDGAALPDVKEYIEKNNLQENVICFGMQNDVRPFYKVADVTLICSLREGLTLTTYESLSMGVPIVSSNVGGQKELIVDDCGLIMDTYQTPDEQFDFNYSEEEILKYCEAITKVISVENKEEIKLKCRNRIKEKFTIDKMINTIDKEFTKLILSKSTVNSNICKNVELAERYLLVHSVLESKDERKKY